MSSCAAVTPAGPEPEGLRGLLSGAVPPLAASLPRRLGRGEAAGRAPRGVAAWREARGGAAVTAAGGGLGTALRYGAAGPGRGGRGLAAGGLRPHNSGSCLSLGRRVASPTPSWLERNRWITGCGCKVREIKWECKKKKKKKFSLQAVVELPYACGNNEVHLPLSFSWL